MTSAREVIEEVLHREFSAGESQADAILAALEAEGLALVRSDFVASKMVRAAHFLICYNYQGFVKDDPPRDKDGNCIWRVWHLAPEVRDHMTAAEQELYDALMPILPNSEGAQP